jgi:GDP/UDP-N,N'-diacetylbacillosamine 2-epimerase (hydrolysing)
MRRICVYTGSRAEYGILKPLLDELAMDEGIVLQILASGTHFSPEFGWTFKEIEKDGFTIDEKIETLMSSDTPVAICKSMGLGLISYAEAIERLHPDLVVILGDRYESFIMAAAATVCKVPIVHIHGGEITQGAMDEAFRHSITKMSHLHFTIAEEYKKRVIQLGENPDTVFNVGSLGIENIRKLKLLTKEKLTEQLCFCVQNHYILITYHPTTLENSTSESQFNNLLDALSEFQDFFLVFTKANADTGGRAINQMIDGFVASNKDRSAAYASLGQLKYLSAMKHAMAVVGNSSSGIIEAPSFGIPVVNIGDRQKGRVRSENIIDCDNDKNSIVKALHSALKPDFRESLKKMISPFEKADTAKTIKEIIKTVHIHSFSRKIFFDCNFTIGK